ncbi:hypothetical protein M0657_007357 [Pyricularia oryzae]|uniref:Uncharacterized protein n=2 Tax=Pyricularia oryzae TaxID=318829 RepID=A0AA97P005_PYRO3|nr:hypothetical protein OOU_Y34scaffold00510g21 [Pyricularia oryzae Y34]KAI7918971.1 hypothetical protein M0657_007357 [Pyricularia oryzae]KAI7930654.1 hypothetical protein M9X92_000718 [Pyricularia oryzae]
MSYMKSASQGKVIQSGAVSSSSSEAIKTSVQFIMGKTKAVWQWNGHRPKNVRKEQPTNVGCQRMSALTPTATLSYPSAPQKPRSSIVCSFMVV